MFLSYKKNCHYGFDEKIIAEIYKKSHSNKVAFEIYLCVFELILLPLRLVSNRKCNVQH